MARTPASRSGLARNSNFSFILQVRNYQVAAKKGAKGRKKKELVICSLQFGIEQVAETKQQLECKN